MKHDNQLGCLTNCCTDL